MCSVYCAMCSVQCAVCSVQCAVCSVQCAVCSIVYTVYYNAGLGILELCIVLLHRTEITKNCPHSTLSKVYQMRKTAKTSQDEALAICTTLRSLALYYIDMVKPIILLVILGQGAGKISNMSPREGSSFLLSFFPCMRKQGAPPCYPRE